MRNLSADGQPGEWGLELLAAREEGAPGVPVNGPFRPHGGEAHGRGVVRADDEQAEVAIPEGAKVTTRRYGGTRCTPPAGQASRLRR